MLDWPSSGTLSLPNVDGKVVKASILGAPAAAVKVTGTDDGFALELPSKAPDPTASVIVLELLMA